ncbi:MAG: CsbD family protein [Vicinamibacterales bacterium]
MNEDTLKGQWKQIKGAAKTRWGKLTDDEIDQVDGQIDQLVGRVQERYGIARDEARRQVDEWARQQQTTA